MGVLWEPVKKHGGADLSGHVLYQWNVPVSFDWLYERRKNLKDGIVISHLLVVRGYS